MLMSDPGYPFDHRDTSSQFRFKLKVFTKKPESENSDLS